MPRRPSMPAWDGERPGLPDRDEIAALEPFPRLDVADITRVADARAAADALARLASAATLGFDTESRPTFVRGEVSDGPHVVQFATLEHAWVFQLVDEACRQAAVQLLESPRTLKVGFGLASDRKRLADRFGVVPHSLVDLDTLFRERGYRKEVGVKAAVALVFGQRFVKSRRLTTSNWSTPVLSDAQLVYAANDAYAAIRVYHALPQPTGTPPIG